MSALPPKADLRDAKANVCFGPEADMVGRAVASMMSDMRKYPGCEVPHEIHVIGIFAAAAGDAALARTYIDGFN